MKENSAVWKGMICDCSRYFIKCLTYISNSLSKLIYRMLYGSLKKSDLFCKYIRRFAMYLYIPFAKITNNHSTNKVTKTNFVLRTHFDNGNSLGIPDDVHIESSKQFNKCKHELV